MTPWLVLALACAPLHRLAAAEARLTALEDKLSRLETVVAIPASEADQQAADALVAEAAAALQALDLATARDAVNIVLTRYPDTRAGRGLVPTAARLSAIGNDVSTWRGADGAPVVTTRTALVLFAAGDCRDCLPVLAQAAALGPTSPVVVVTPAGDSRWASSPVAAAAAPFPRVDDPGGLRALFGAATVPHVALIVDQRVVWNGGDLSDAPRVLAHFGAAALPPTP